MLTALLVISMSACSQGKNKKEGKYMEKVLVAYFSASGVTKGMAQQLADVAKAELYEIKPTQPYTADDLDWTNQQSRSSIEMKNKNSRPSISKDLSGIDEYKIIYIGFPIWWYTCPTIINTFLETYDFSGKTVIPFATSGGSSIDKACTDLKAAYPNINWKEGKLLNQATKGELEKWVNDIK